MSDLIDRAALCEECGGSVIKCVGMGCKVMTMEAVEAVEVGNCVGCIWSNRKRPQKCSCCRRNPDMKDCYEVDNG